MPLSEQEQRLLEEMERSLYNNDSDFVARVTRRQGRPTYTAITIGVLIGLVGVGVIVLGLVIKQPLIGVLGFVVMLASSTVALTAMRGSQQAGAVPADPRSAMHPSRGFTVVDGGRSSRLRRPRRSGGAKPSGSFMERMEERWRHRRDQGF